MNEKTIRALVDAGAIKRMHIIANGSCFHVEADTQTGTITASTLKGSIKTWRNLDSAARWVRGLGMGKAQLSLSRWQPNQHGMQI